MKMVRTLLSIDVVSNAVTLGKKRLKASLLNYGNLRIENETYTFLGKKLLPIVEIERDGSRNTQLSRNLCSERIGRYVSIHQV